jgi:hypothetical protein
MRFHQTGWQYWQLSIKFSQIRIVLLIKETNSFNESHFHHLIPKHFHEIFSKKSLQNGKNQNFYVKTGQEFSKKFRTVVTPFCYDHIERPKESSDIYVVVWPMHMWPLLHLWWITFTINEFIRQFHQSQILNLRILLILFIMISFSNGNLRKKNSKRNVSLPEAGRWCSRAFFLTLTGFVYFKANHALYQACPWLCHD